MGNAPLVSIVCLAFNQERYIGQALEGMLGQKTNFTFEILINDDASTDQTQKIIKEYQKNNPGVITAIFQHKNQYSLGKRNFIGQYLLPKAKGKYIAICEGDDYWTDEQKLQKQVEFLEKNNDYTVCFHPVNVAFENSKAKPYVYPDVKDEKWYSNEELLKVNFIPTCSVMYRKQSYKNMPTNISPADWYLHIYHAAKGKIKYIDEVMAVYRKHDAGIWKEYDNDRDQIWRKHGIAYLTMYDEVLKLYKSDKKAVEVIRGNIDELLRAFVKVDKKYNEGLIRQAMAKFPEHCERLLLDEQKKLSHELKENQKLWKAINEQSEMLAFKQDVIDIREKELRDLQRTKMQKAKDFIYKRATNLKNESTRKSAKMGKED